MTVRKKMIGMVEKKTYLIGIVVKSEKRKKIMRLEKGHEVLEPLPQDHNPLPESLPGSQVSPYRMAEKKSSEIRKIL